MIDPAPLLRDAFAQPRFSEECSVALAPLSVTSGSV